VTTRARIDPELMRQLKSAAASRSEPVEAVLRLRPPKSARSLAPSPDATRALAEGLVSRVAQELGTDAGQVDFNVFANLGYFVVSAPSAFVERIVSQPEIASAASNRRRV
jgi:hypothetical protein